LLPPLHLASARTQGVPDRHGDPVAQQRRRHLQAPVRSRRGPL